MAKVSPVSIKYMIHASFKAEGPLEKPDVIGAIFGQTEGLLGSELEMRELQKEGKIGRIEVNITPKGGKSIGNIEIPSSLDIVETSILAAAIEATNFHNPICPIYQNVVAKAVNDPSAIKQNLIDQLTGAVKWTQSVQAMIADGATHFTEVGPGKVLKFAIRPSQATGKYYLVADWKQDKGGEIMYGGETYYATALSGNAYLMVVLKKCQLRMA